MPLGLVAAALSLLATDGHTLFMAPGVVCPDAPGLARALAELNAGADTARPRRVLVSADGPTIAVELQTAEGIRVAARRIDGRAPCPDVTAAVAVFVATWEAEAPAGAVPPPLPLPAPTIATAAATGPAPPAPAARASVALALLAPATMESAAPGAVGELAWGFGPPGGAAGATRPWAARLALSALAFRERGYEGGQARWARVALGLGAARRWQTGRVGLQLQADLLGAVLFLEGAGFGRDRDGRTFDPGAALGGRAHLGRGRVRPFVGVELRAWATLRHVRVAGAARGFDLPRVDALLGAGAALH